MRSNAIQGTVLDYLYPGPSVYTGPGLDQNLSKKFVHFLFILRLVSIAWNRNAAVAFKQQLAQPAKLKKVK